MDFDDEKILPMPVPALSMIDFRRYFCGETSGRIGLFDGAPRWCTADELAYHQEMRKHDRQPPWEKKFVYGEHGLSHRSLVQLDRYSGNEIVQV
jgi:hypothetical protein